MICWMCLYVPKGGGGGVEGGMDRMSDVLRIVHPCSRDNGVMILTFEYSLRSSDKMECVYLFLMLYLV